jgi:hypothetical protein
MAVAQRAINQAVDDELSHDVAWWDALSIEALIVHFFHERWQAYGAPQATFDALLYELRTHGLPQLRNPDCRRRLGDVSDAQLEDLIAALIRLQPNYYNITDELILALDGIIRL